MGVLLPGVAAAGVLALPGCGGDDPVRTVTVTAPEAAAAPTTTARTTATVPATTTARSRPQTPTTTATEPVTTTVVETTTTGEPSAPPSTTTGGAPDDARGTAAPRPGTLDPDPVGGTTAASGRAAGTGYSVQVPTGWNDGAKRFEGSSLDVDRTYVKGRGSDVTTSILVVRSTPSGARSRGIDGLATTVRRQLQSGAGGADVAQSASRRVDGEPAIAFVVRRSLGDTAIVQRQVAVLRGSALYIVGLTAARRTYDDDERTFARFLASWRWTTRAGSGSGSG